MNRHFTRREFLWAGGGVFAFGLCGAYFNKKWNLLGRDSGHRIPYSGEIELRDVPSFVGGGMGRLLLPSLRTLRESFGSAFPDAQNAVGVLDFGARRFRWAETPLRLTHSSVLVPNVRHKALIFEKDGPLACLIGLDPLVVESVIRARPGWHFNGHGVFSRDGKYLYDTEYQIKNKDLSKIFVRDGRTFEIVGELESHGIQPHDLCFIGGGSKLVVGHYGRLPDYTPSELGATVNLLEMPTGRLIEKVPAARGNHAMCHVAATEDGRVIVSVQDFVKLPRPEGVAKSDMTMNALHHQQKHTFAPVMIGQFGKGKSAWHQVLPEEKHRFTFNFSTVIHEETHIAGMAHIHGKYVSFFNLKTGEFLKGYDVRFGASGIAITLDRRFFLATTGGGVHFFDVEKLRHRGFLSIGANLAAPHVSIF